MPKPVDSPHEDQGQSRFAPQFSADPADGPLMGSLRRALAPQSLPPRLVRRIAAELDQRMAGRRSRLILRYSWISAAAAAVVLLLIWQRPVRQESASPVSATALAAAPVVAWDSGSEFDLALYTAGVQVEVVAVDTERMQREESYLTWSDADSWDQPSRDGGPLR